MRYSRDRMTGDPHAVLPRHYVTSLGQRVSYVLAIVVALVLLVSLAAQLATSPRVAWWWIGPGLVGAVAADLLSGLVHWGADTWGRDDLPVIGRRLLVPFRVHHMNPDDFLQRSFIDTNGDVALIFVPCLVAGLLLASAGYLPIACFVFGLALVGLLTNQTHQWAHRPAPPRVVRWCQESGLILGRHAHAAHHARPYDVGYCIATGWCNRPLEAVGFFRRLEHLVTAVTGAEPRRDDDRYARRHGPQSATTHQ